LIGFIENLKEIIIEVVLVLLPLSVLFLIFQKYLLKLPKQYTKNLLKGIFLTFVGMILFFKE